MNKTELSTIIIGKLLNIGGILQREGDRLLQPFDLNQTQFSILFEIEKVKKVKQKEMVNRLCLEKAHVSKVVKKLVKMNLLVVTISKEDKRSSWLSVTPKGKKTVEKCMTIFKKWNVEWLSDIDSNKHLLILDNLQIIQDVFQNKIQK